MSAVNDVSRINDLAADGLGNPAVLDPLPGFPTFPNHPFFERNLKFVSTMDRAGRIRLAAVTIQEG